MSEQAVSIGELEAIRAKMTPGEWVVGEDDNQIGGDCDHEDGPSCIANMHDESRLYDAAGIVAEHNAFPVLAAAVKAALRYIALVDTQGKLTPEHLTDVFAAKDELRAALRKVRL